MYKVSVIIPFYNVEAYLRHSLDSVVNQTLQNIEIICVDDGSSDRSCEIVAEYMQRHDNIKLIRQENSGPSKARNAGLEIATGEYIYFLDSDDTLVPGALQTLYGKAAQEQLDILYFNTETVFENEALQQTNEMERLFYIRTGDYSGLCTGQTMFVRMRKDTKFLVPVWIMLLRRAFLEENRIRFYEGIIHEDNLFTFRCTMCARRVNYIPDQLYRRRVRVNSIMTSQKSIRHVEGYLVCYYESLTLLRDISLEEGLQEQVFNFLHYSLFGGACRSWMELSPEEREKPLRCGIPAVEQLLYVVKRETELTDTLQHRNASLKLQLENAKARSGRLADRNRMLKTQLEQSFFCQVKKHGLLRTLRVTFRKGCAVLTGILAARTRGSVKAYFTLAKEKGYRFALRETARLRKQARQARSVRRLMETGGKAPLVSVVVPVYNAEKFLPECLESLLKQTMKHIEIICVDDGSTDNSLEILRSYEKKDPRVRVFTQKNQFAGAARNYGLSKARGEYVCFLDADDFFAGNLVEDTYYAAKMNQADAVLFNAIYYDNATKEYRETPWLLVKEYAPQNQPFSWKDCPDTLFQITTPCPWTKLFRRQFLLDTGLQFPGLRNSEDVAFTYCAMAMAERIATVDKALVYYRIGLTNSLEGSKNKQPMCFYEAYRLLQSRLKELGRLDPLRKTYVNTVLSGCMYNLNLQKDPALIKLLESELGTHGFRELELDGHSKDYYYIPSYYDRMQGILAAYSGGRDDDQKS